MNFAGSKFYDLNVAFHPPRHEGPYRICKRCVMDTSDPNITFDENGVCNHCHDYDNLVRNRIPPPAEANRKLTELIARIRKAGANKPYDCVIGVSGGVDSTYVAKMVKDFGLRPLAVHLDNGWDSETAVSNISKALHKMRLDLYTHVIDWEEFKDIQRSFLLASVPDAEVPTDHAIFATLVKQAVAIGVHFVITGLNVRTETHLPMAWSQGHWDWGYVRTIHRRFGSGRIRTYPHFNFYNYLARSRRGRVEQVDLLDLLDYSPSAARTGLQRELGWEDYGGKHFESLYTRWFHGCYLPYKFGFDKRRAHLSSLICSGELSRFDALKQLQSPPYPIEQQEADCEYVATKLGFSQQEFAAMMRALPRKFSDFPSYSSFVSSEGFQRIVRLRQLLFRRQSAPPMLNSRPTAAAPTVGLYFISGARKSYNIAKTLSLAGCKVLVRVEPSQVELTDRNHPNHVDRHYCALLYSDEKIELIADASKAPPVDALLHELCLTPSRHSTELRAWTRQTARVAAWNSSWHEMSAWANLRSELSIVSKFFEFLPRTRTVVMHNGRRIFRPTALFSRSFRQGAFVHPLFLFDPELRAEMFGVGWQPNSPRRAALIFAGDAASPRRRILLEQCRRFMEKRPDAHIVQTYDEALSSPLWPKADKKLVLWMAALEGQHNTIPMALWPAVLRNCDFCLCPPGYEQKSHRVIECLLQGAIPILHCPEEYDIGMRDGVNCIIVRNGDWETGLARAMDCDFAAIVRMRTEVAELVNKHLSHRGCAKRWLRFMGLDPAALDGVSAA